MQRRSVLATAAVALVGAVIWAGGASAEDDGTLNGTVNTAKCSTATLRGTYLFAFDGHLIQKDGHHPVAVAGQEYFDGEGHVRGIFSLSVNGDITRHIHQSGTYTVRSNCTGSGIYPATADRWDMFIDPDGSDFTFVETTKGFVASGTESRATAKRVG
jgi:hypothetical protein